MTLAVGFFDGVHLGHRKILQGAEIALTFRNHPLSVLAPERAPKLLMSVEEKTAAMRECGVREIQVLDFTPELAAMEPEAFLEKYLAHPALTVRCGENWRFGRGGRGDADCLRRHGIAVEVVPYAQYAGERISSTRIRRAFSAGEIETGNAMLGRALALGGAVEQGKGVGARLGFPTVNIAVESKVELPFGAYVVEAGGVRGVANYGLAPTMGEKAWKQPVLEVHWLGIGQTQFDHQGLQFDHQGLLKVELLRFLRPERKFATLAELQAQIARDCEEAAKPVSA